MNRKLFYILALILPAILVFKALLTGEPASWGDAPYFHFDGLKELAAEPYLWTARGNLFGGINQLLWFAPIMYLYGLLGSALGFTNEVIIRILFYFPSIVLSFITPLMFVKQLKLGNKVGFFTSLLYVFNTYYLLLIDGGQVGVALGYGLFPLILILFIRKAFLQSIVLGFIMSMVDPRFLIIAVITSLFWLRNIKDLLKLILILFCICLLSLYWLTPLLGVSSYTPLTASSLQLVSFLNPLLLYQPHWPGNVFGLVTQPPWYFAVLPVLIFWEILIKKKKFIFLGIVFLVLAFLVKGNTPPFGNFYTLVVNNIPFGFSLRDSTKFFAPLILIAGVLIGLTTKALDKKFKYSSFIVYFILLFLVSPAMLGKLNFVLSSRNYNADIKLINDHLKKEPGLFRVAWFPEIHPTSYHTNLRQSLDAKTLVSLPPLRNLNVGDYDVFNFIHNNKFVDWFRLFGIKYLVIQPDPRRSKLNDEEIRNYKDLIERVASVSGIIKKDWTQELPVYEIPNIKPRVMASDKLIAVIGETENQSTNIPFVFFEDGKLNPLHLQNTASDSAYLYFSSQKEQLDLEMSFLQKFFVPAIKHNKSDWADYNSDQNLKWRFEALIRNVKTQEFDYDLGITFSDVANEQLKYSLPVDSSGEYILAIRALSRDAIDKLGINASGMEFEFTSSREGFGWFSTPLGSIKDNLRLTITNKSGFWIINNIALIPKKNFDKARSIANTYVNHFKVINNAELEQIISTNHWKDVNFEFNSPTRVKVAISDQSRWLFFADSYNQSWYLRHGQDFYSSLPAYSSVNLFYTREANANYEVVYRDQTYIRWGIYLSILSLVSMMTIYLMTYKK